MNRVWRTILFTLFAVGFFISAPLVVFYTAGYRYKFGTTHFVKTGILSVSSTPRGADIYLDGQQNEKNTPAVIDNLIPHDVKIRVEKSGYSSWEKTLPVKSGETTFVSNLKLFLTEPPTLFLNQSSLIDVALIDPTHFAYLNVQKETLELWVQDPGFLENRKLFKQTWHPKSSYKIYWSLDRQYVLIEESTSKKIYTLVNVRDATTIILPFKDAVQSWWSVGSNHELFYQIGMELRSYGIDNESFLPKKLRAKDAQQKDGRLIVVQSEDQSIVSYLDAKNVASIFAYLPLGNYHFIPAPSAWLMLNEIQKDRLVIIDPNQQQSIRFNETARLWQWSPKEDRLLYSDGFDIKIFSTQSGNIETVTRLSESISSLAWDPSGDVLFYSQGSEIRVLELDRREVRNETTVVKDFLIKTFWVNKDGSNLLFFGNKNNEPAGIFEKKLEK